MVVLVKYHSERDESRIRQKEKSCHHRISPGPQDKQTNKTNRRLLPGFLVSLLSERQIFIAFTGLWTFGMAFIHVYMETVYKWQSANRCIITAYCRSLERAGGCVQHPEVHSTKGVKYPTVERLSDELMRTGAKVPPAPQGLSFSWIIYLSYKMKGGR